MLINVSDDDFNWSEDENLTKEQRKLALKKKKKGE